MVSLGVALEILLFLILKFDFYFYPYVLLYIFWFWVFSNWYEHLYIEEGIGDQVLLGE